MPVKSGPIEWEVFKKSFLGKYLPRERREVKVEGFIDLWKDNVSVHDSKHRRSTRILKRGHPRRKTYLGLRSGLRKKVLVLLLGRSMLSIVSPVPIVALIVVRVDIR